MDVYILIASYTLSQSLLKRLVIRLDKLAQRKDEVGKPSRVFKVQLTTNMIFDMYNIWVILRRNGIHLYSKILHLDQLS